MENSDKENDPKNVMNDEKIKKSNSESALIISSDESDSDIVVSRKSKSSKRIRPKAYIIESDDSDCDAGASDPIFNYENIWDDYESPNVLADSFASEGNYNGESMVLGTDIQKNQDIVVHPKIVAQLKPHQIDGLKFLFACCYNDLNVAKTYRELDHGCILAHCMGLGKTFQLIALLHTVIRYPQLKTQKILVICPKSTVLNWKAEIEKWLRPIKGGRKLKVFTFLENSSIEKKVEVLKEWFELSPEYDDDAGCLLLGYEAFMKIVNYSASKNCTRLPAEARLIEKNISKYLLKPGADLVVLDEGHRIKNLKTATSQAVNRIRTRRRIILTGTPMQNNLKEYYSMVNFIKPDFLGSKADFSEEYANPIRIGQHKDSSAWEVREMVEKSYILHKKLSDFVQRRDVTVLKEFLPKKCEYDIFISMTPIQNELYEHYLQENPLKDGKKLLPDYHMFRKIWTHPKVLEIAFDAAWNEYKRKNQERNDEQLSESEFSSDDDNVGYRLGPDGELIIAFNGDEKEVPMFSPLHNWWKSHISEEQLNSILSSNKVKILFEILKICEREKEKCLIFSEYTKVLDLVEIVMKQITERIELNENFDGLEEYECDDSVWKRASDYYRLDGSTSQSDRHDMINRFNDPNETRLRAFLISSKAGGQGINLTGATRVVMLDTSWNPSNDQQSIFRVFRLGQERNCFIYRLLAMGTMEEKVYSRSVTKQATSCRVVDKQQVERHYNMAELIELYTLTKPEELERPVPDMPIDTLLAYLLDKHPEIIFKYQEHESLLEEVEDSILTEEDKENLWLQYKINAIAKAQAQVPNTSSNMSSNDSCDENSILTEEHKENLWLDYKINAIAKAQAQVPDTSSNTSSNDSCDESSDESNELSSNSGPHRLPNNDNGASSSADSAAKKRKMKKPKLSVKKPAKKSKRSIF